METQKRQEKCEQWKKTVALIDALPEDVTRKIYNDFILGKKLYHDFQQQIKSECSMRLEYLELTRITKEILKIPCLVDYIRKRDKLFDHYYISHYVEDQKNFKRLEKDESFVLCMLMSLYH